MIKVPDYNGGFVSKQVEGNFVVTRDNEGYLLNSEPVNFIKKSLECKYGTVIDYSANIVVLKKGTKTVKVNREELNNYLSLQLEANQDPQPQKLLVTGTFETEAGKVLVKGIDDNLRSVFSDPDKIEVDKKRLVFRKSIGNKFYFAEAEQVEKQMLVKSIDVAETFKRLLIKGVATTLKPPSISTGDAWNRKGGTKPGHKYLERKPHPSGEGYIYLYKLPNGTAEWRDDNGKAIDVKDTGEQKPYSVDEFKIGDNVKQGDELGRVDDVSTNLLAVNFGGKVRVINKKEHVEKLKEHQLYKPGQIIKTNKGDAKILQMTDNLALIKRIDDNVLDVINLEKHITKIKKEDADNLRSKLDKFNYVNEGYAENDYEQSFSKVDYKNTKEFQQYQDKATKAGFGDGELKRKKYVKAGNNIHTVEWRYDPHSKETIFYADGVKNLPVEFAGKRYSVTDIDSEGYTLNGDGESGLRLSHKDYKQYWDNYKDEVKKDSVKTSDAYGDTMSSPKETFHISGKLSDEQLAKIDAEKKSGPSYKVRWKSRDKKLQTDEEKATIEAERQQKLVSVKEALGSDAYKQFENSAKERGFEFGENRFNAQKIIEVEGNKFVVQSEFDPEAGASNRVTGKYSDLELGDNIYPITDITKDKVFYNEQGTEKSISIDELKQINGKKVFEPTRETKGFISKNPATRFYFSPDEGDAVSGFYEVVELDDLIASHKAGGEANPLYSIGDAQNRDRSKQQSKAQIAKIATNPNFDLLSDNKTVQDGAPVVNEDYEIIAGNGRGIGIGEHYAQGGEKYKNDLMQNAKRLGFNVDDLSGMSKPVLVRRVNVDNEQAQKLGAKSNESNMLKTEAREEAKGKATRIDDKTFNSIADIFKNAKGDYASISDYLEDVGPDLVKKLSEKGIISDNEKHLYYDLESGKLDASHKDKLKDLLTQSILGDSSQHFEKIPDAAREGITKGLGELFSIKGQPSDLIPHLQNAVKILAKYSSVKDKFSSPDDFIAQDANNMLDPLKGDKKDLAVFEALTSTKPNEIKNKFKEYVAKLEGDMFEQPLSPDEAFKEVFKPKYESGINKSLWTRVKVFGINLFKGIDKSKNELRVSEKNPKVKRWQKIKNSNQEILQEVNSIKPIEIVYKDIIDEEAEKEYLQLETVENEYDERKIRFVKELFGKIVRQKGKELIFNTIIFWEKLLNQAIPIYSDENAKKEKHPNVKEFHNYLNKVRIDKIDYYLRFTVQEVITRKKTFIPNELHNVFISDVEIIEADKLQIHSGFQPPTKMLPIGFDTKLADWFRKVKSESVVKKALSVSIFGKLMKSQQMDMFTGQTDERGNVLMPSKKNPNVRRYQKNNQIEMEGFGAPKMKGADDYLKPKGKDEKETPLFNQEEKDKNQLELDSTELKSLDEANDWMEKKAKEYGGKNKFLASDEYKKVYPKIEALHKQEKSKYQEKAKQALDEVGQKEGDEVEYSAGDPFGNVFVYEGKIVLKDGIPYVNLNKKTVDGKKQVKWHKGFIKVQNNQYDIKDRNKVQADILKQAGIPEEEIPDYVLDSVADGKILGKRAEAVIDGDIKLEEAAEKVKQDYEKMKSGEKDTKFLEQENELKPDKKKGEIMVYHYTKDENFAGFENRDKGIWFTNNQYGYSRRSQSHKQIKAIINTNELKLATEKEFNFSFTNGTTEDRIKALKERGFDGAKFNVDGDKHYLIFDKANLKLEGQQKKTPQTESEAFKNWFRDSKVVDESGKPLVVYHGTKDNIDKFNPDKTEDGGIHFGSHKQASGHRNPKNIIPVYLSIKKPLFIQDQGLKWKEYIDGAKAKGYDGIIYVNRYEGIAQESKVKYYNDKMADEKKLAGSFDFLVQREIDKLNDDEFKMNFPEAELSYIVFNPEQIKSAIGNEGSFDPENKSITKGLKVFGKSLAQGVKIESEHEDLYNELCKRLEEENSKMPMSKKEFFTWIAEEHFGENPDYYSLLKKYVK